jgi:hypothetical protein
VEEGAVIPGGTAMSTKLARHLMVSLLFITIQAPVFISSTFANEVTLAQLPGSRINANWFRYINPRFGLAVDIPTKGYRYYVPDNGSGLTLQSELVTITLYAHFVSNLVTDANNNVQNSVSKLFDDAISQTLQKDGTVDYSVRKDDFYVISGAFGKNVYYERLTISAKCAAIFNSLRIFYPKSLERSLDGLVTKMSRSLRATCQGGDVEPIENPRDQ